MCFVVLTLHPIYACFLVFLTMLYIIVAFPYMVNLVVQCGIHNFGLVEYNMHSGWLSKNPYLILRYYYALERCPMAVSQLKEEDLAHNTSA